MRKIILFVTLLVWSSAVTGSTLAIDDLIGEWKPSGEIPRDATSYTFSVAADYSATYTSELDGFQLQCSYKPNPHQDSIFVFYCFHDSNHLITLSLGGWSIKNGKLLYGFEYWLDYDGKGNIYGGLPVSLKPKST